jgi:hypothetical protein
MLSNGFFFFGERFVRKCKGLVIFSSSSFFASYPHEHHPDVWLGFLGKENGGLGESTAGEEVEWIHFELHISSAISNRKDQLVEEALVRNAQFSKVEELIQIFLRMALERPRNDFLEYRSFFSFFVFQFLIQFLQRKKKAKQSNQQENKKGKENETNNENKILVWVGGIVCVLEDKFPDVRLVECAQLVAESLSLEEAKAGHDHRIWSNVGFFEEEVTIVHLAMVVNLSGKLVFR